MATAPEESVMKPLFLFLILGVFVGPVLAQEDPNLTYSVTSLVNDPATSEVSIRIDNLEVGEIWNVNVRLETGYLGLCPAVFQLGRIPVGGMQVIRSTCVGPPDPLDTAVLLWRIDFDSESGHRQTLTTGFEDSESAGGGP